MERGVILWPFRANRCRCHICQYLGQKRFGSPLHHRRNAATPPPQRGFPHYQLLATIWPIVCFIVITSIIVHGSSVAVLTLGKRLNRMAITMSFTTDQEGNGSGGWMQRLQKLDRATTSFSLHRVDTMAPTENCNQKLPAQKCPTGGAKRKKNHRDDRTPPEAQILQLGATKRQNPNQPQTPLPSQTKHQGYLHLERNHHKSRKGTSANRCLPRW